MPFRTDAKPSHDFAKDLLGSTGATLADAKKCVEVYPAKHGCLLSDAPFLIPMPFG